jgi:CRP-like cAMP-binding protein
MVLYHELLFEKFDKFSIIFNHGETGRKMYFILSGEVGILLPTGK